MLHISYHYKPAKRNNQMLINIDIKKATHLNLQH